MEPSTEEGRSSSRLSSISASETAVNPHPSPKSPQFSRNNVQPDTLSSGSASSSNTDISSVDSEPPLPEDPIQGWPQLALLMAKTPDFAAFPRFRDLNIKSLLYYQCQLSIYRTKLHELEYTERGGNKRFAEFADNLVESDSEQFKIIKEMRIVLKEYNEALLQYHQMCNLQEPEPINMRTLRKWLRNQECGDYKVKGRDGLDDTWGKLSTIDDNDVRSLWRQFISLTWGLMWMRPLPKSDLDLAVPTSRAQVDGLTRWVATEFIPFHRALVKYWKKTKPKDGDVELATTPSLNTVQKVEKQETLVSWSENGALRVTSAISTLIACLLPVIAIAVLSQLHGLTDLLWGLAGFALIFALGLIFMTQGTSKRTEVFAATAAFSAVMVVFISVPPAPIIVVPPGSTTASFPTPTSL